MSRILCTFPGRYGDILWALPTIRLISEHYATPVDLVIGREFAPLVLLLQQQAYLHEVWADPLWELTPGALTPPCVLVPPGYLESYDAVHHLAYKRWPERPLPFEVYERVASGWVPPLDLTRPWITVDGPGIPCDVAVGFTEAWFELKLGLLVSMERMRPPELLTQLTPLGSRWCTEVPPATLAVYPCDWLDTARAIRNSDLFFGDVAALHVLAVALGKRAVICEPMEARWNPIFWPLGMDGPQVTCVKGTDGKPTFDARHCADALKEALRG